MSLFTLKHFLHLYSNWDMNSPVARLIKIGLRLQRPLLRRVRNPQQIGPVQALLERVSLLPARTSLQRKTLSGIPYLEIHNQLPNRRMKHILVYVHGGGFAVGSPDTHRAFAARLMQAGQFEMVVMPQYRLTSQQPWPASLEDVRTFYRALRMRHPEAAISFAGESAGANLCVTTSLLARDADETLPERIYLHSPWLDVSLSGNSYTDLSLEDGFTGRHRGRREWIHDIFARHYIGQADPNHPHMSPIFADLHGLPPIYIQVGAKELFLDDSKSLKAGCDAGHTPCLLEEWPGMWHAFGMFAPVLPEANKAIRRAGDWLRGD